MFYLIYCTHRCTFSKWHAFPCTLNSFLWIHEAVSVALSACGCVCIFSRLSNYWEIFLSGFGCYFYFLNLYNYYTQPVSNRWLFISRNTIEATLRTWGESSVLSATKVKDACYLLMQQMLLYWRAPLWIFSLCRDSKIKLFGVGRLTIIDKRTRQTWFW